MVIALVRAAGGGVARMNESDQDTTIGTGGWIVVVLAGLATFLVIRFLLDQDLFPALAFAIAVALLVLLLLYRLAIAVNRHDDELEAQRVRKIVPATVPNDGGARVSGVEGAQAPAAKAVRVGTDSGLTASAPARPSMVVTPLAEVLPAPLIAPSAATRPALAPEAEAPKAVPKADAKPKAEAKPKAAAKAWSEKPAKDPKTEKPPVTSDVLVRLTAPRKGKADDLKEIEGIGPALEKLLNSLGFYHFDQIAAWTEDDVALVDAEMKSFKGRITRDKWVAQAKLILAVGLDVFRERAKTNKY
jgi:predicted flap endonuclease-1-like 5' DNA nuclease